MSRKAELVVDVVIPAFDEEDSIGLVVKEIPSDRVREIVVVDNNSTDRTAEKAREDGATVLREGRQGYGSACLKGIGYLKEKQEPPEVVVFMDADHSDRPEEMEELLKPIEQENMDMVIGSRALGNTDKGAMLPQQVFGNKLATTLMRWLYGSNYTDLGPFRAIRFDKLVQIGMKDPDYGWTVEMQLKALLHDLAYTEVPVSYRKRIGKSKIAGTLKGTAMAGYKIISTIFKYRKG